MAWIESHQKLEKSSKLIHMARILGVNKYQAIGHLHAFWWWALDDAKDGNITAMDNIMLAEISGWSSYCHEAQELERVTDLVAPSLELWGQALQESGFSVTLKSGERYIKNWQRYTERYFDGMERISKQRELTNERVRRYRERNADVTQDVTLPERSVTHLTIPDLTVPNQTKENITPSAKAGILRFSKPSAKEVEDYAITIGFPLEGQQFIDYYESKGWKIGNSPMRDWKAAVRTWKRNGYQTNGGTNGTNGSKSFSSDDFKRISAGRSSDLRKIPPPGEILARIRDL